MKAIKIAGTFLAVLFALVLFSPTARADDFDQMTRLTFNQPIQIPGSRVLPAGTYWFALANHGNSPDAVVVYNADRSEVEAMLLTRPTYRTTHLGRTQVTFTDQSQNSPDALIKWFYPGTADGHDFIYSNRTQRSLDENVSHTVIVQPD